MYVSFLWILTLNYSDSSECQQDADFHSQIQSKLK